ncbi:MAG: CcdB family protein [Burkholderiales bacterium]|nr:CcdB family protein [Burkholderiales bacterium]MBK8665711.1 CcdB family protein [Burkholderiales bacterium]
MAQFDVHTYRGPRRGDVAYVVLVQSALFDGYRRRVVVPLVRRDALRLDMKTVGSRLTPVFQVEGLEVVLNPLDMVSMDVVALGAKVPSLAQQGQEITDALDELFTRSWG